MKNCLKNEFDKVFLDEDVQNSEKFIKKIRFNAGLFSGFAGYYASSGVDALLSDNYAGGAYKLGLCALSAGCAVHVGKKISQEIKRLKGLSEKVGESRALRASSELTEGKCIDVTKVSKCKD